MARLAILLLLVWSAAGAQKKAITLEALAGERAASEPSAPVWSADGRQFAYTEGGKVRLYDIGSRSKRELVSLSTLEAAGTKAPAPAQAEWVNRNVREDAVAWMPSGRELLLAAGGDLFLVPAGGGAWSRLTETPEAERDAKVSPNGRWE